MHPGLTRDGKNLESQNMPSRIQKLRKLITQKRLTGLLVTSPPNIRYLCGYTGSNGLVLISRHRAYFFTDFRYQEQAKRQVHDCRVHIRRRDLFADFPTKYLLGIDRLGFERSHLTVARLQALRRQVENTRLIGVDDLVIGLRRTKENLEVELIRQAQRFTEEAFSHILGYVKPGVRELDLAAEVEFLFRQHGERAFPSIVATGPNAAFPHAEPSDRRLRKGDVVTFDLGCRYQGYCSDMTRTVFLGRPESTLAEVYHIVLEAQERALAAIKPGAKCAEVDAAARNYIRDMGYADQFGHGLGHGVGLEVHELPGLSYASRDTLAPGDVVTVEPGIYLPGLGGVRIEDMVLITESGYENLTRSPKRLIVL